LGTKSASLGSKFEPNPEAYKKDGRAVEGEGWSGGAEEGCGSLFNAAKSTSVWSRGAVLDGLTAFEYRSMLGHGG